MRTIMLDGSLYTTRDEVHAALKRMLDLPSYYGMNADALHDCLSERGEQVNLWIASKGEGEAADTISLCGRVIEDLGGTVKEI